VSDSNFSVGSSRDTSSSSADSPARSDSQSVDPADVRQQALLFRSLMDAPVTVRQLAELAAQNADVALAERGAGGTLLDPWALDPRTSDQRTADQRTLDQWTPSQWTPADGRDGLQDLADRSHPSAIDVSAMIQAQTADQPGTRNPAGRSGRRSRSVHCGAHREARPARARCGPGAQLH